VMMMEAAGIEPAQGSGRWSLIVCDSRIRAARDTPYRSWDDNDG
jgi:hypothetical protein